MGSIVAAAGEGRDRGSNALPAGDARDGPIC